MRVEGSPGAAGRNDGEEEEDEEEEGPAARRGRKPDSCRGSRAAEGSWELQLVMLLPRRKASLAIPQARRYRPGARTPETQRSSPASPSRVRVGAGSGHA